MKIALGSIDYRIVLPGYVAAWGIAMLPLHIMPFLIASLIDGLGFTEAQAGLLVSIELGAIGVLALVLAPMMSRIPRRTSALLACVIVVLANAASLFGTGAWLVGMRVTSGAGCGVLLATGNATFASSPKPERAYGQATLLNVFVNVAVFNMLPLLMQTSAHKSVYWLTIGVVLIMFPALLLLPKRAPATQAARHAETVGSLRLWMAMAAIAAVLLYCTRDTLIWAFAQNTGRRAGLSDSAIGATFAAHSVVGLLGPLAASLLGTRYGRVRPLVIGLLGTGLITIVLSQSVGSVTYIAMVIPWTALHLFTLSYLMGMAGAIDRSGRVISAAGGAILIADAIAPAIAGFVIGFGGYPLLGAVVASGVILTLGVALTLAKVVDDRPGSP